MVKQNIRKTTKTKRSHVTSQPIASMDMCQGKQNLKEQPHIKQNTALNIHNLIDLCPTNTKEKKFLFKENLHMILTSKNSRSKKKQGRANAYVNTTPKKANFTAKVITSM